MMYHKHHFITPISLPTEVQQSGTQAGGSDNGPLMTLMVCRDEKLDFLDDYLRFFRTSKI
jgi:hypothetical protein